jgi:serine/threonine protein kinase
MTDLPEDRDPIDALAEEFVHRYRRGEDPSITEYAQRYPELADDIHELFPAATLLEDLKGPPGARARSAEVTVELPRQLGDFRLVREIGRGGMGVVYEAEQVSLGRRVALKVLPAEARLGPEQLARFRREAQAAGRLHHSNIVPVFGVGEHEGLHYYVMQLIPGVGLDRVLAQFRRDNTPHPQPLSPAGVGPASRAGPEAVPLGSRHLPAAARGEQDSDVPGLVPFDHPDYFRQVARLGAQVADALAYAHAQGVLHRDIKPANLLVDAQGTAWVTDFGLAKLLEQDDLTQPGEMAGTLRYSPPERFKGQSDARGDIFSLGLTLYELLTLRPACDETDPGRLLLQVTQANIPRPRARNPVIPRDLETVVLHCLAPEPQRRYGAAAALAADLRRFLDDRPVRARRAGVVEHAWRWCRRNPAVAGLSAALLLAVALGNALVVWKWREASANLAQAHQSQKETLAALEVGDEQRKRAEGNLDLAIEAFGRIGRQLAPSRPGVPVEAGDDDVPAPVVVTPEAAAVLQDMVRFYERYAATNRNDPRLTRDAARALCQVGTIRLRLGQPRKAALSFEKSVELLEAQLDQKLELARTHNDLGVALRQAGRLSAALAAHGKALDGLQKGATPQVPALIRLEQARAYNLRGTLETRQLRFHDAEASQRQALDLLGRLVEEDKKHPGYRHLLARASFDLAVVAWRGEGRPEAHELRATALEVLGKLAEDFPAVPNYRAELAEMLLAGPPWLLISPRQAREAERRCRRAVELAAALASRYPAVPEYRLLLARSHQRLGQAELVQGKSKEAVTELRQALDLHRALVPAQPNLPGYRMLALEARLTLGEALRQRGELAESAGVLRDGLQELKKLPPAAARSPFGRRLHVRFYRSLGATLVRQGKKEEAGEFFRQAEELGGKRP